MVAIRYVILVCPCERQLHRLFNTSLNVAGSEPFARYIWLNIDEPSVYRRMSENSSRCEELISHQPIVNKPSNAAPWIFI